MGLPLRPDHPPEALLSLAGVTARSVRPDDPLARLDALERLLKSELRRFGRPELRSAALLLFGVTRAGGTLSERRRRAANTADYNLDHFRKRLEPQIVAQLAWQLEQDALQYVQRAEDGQPFEASGDTPTISQDDIADVRDAEREALTSRIWECVYGLRAELITRESLRGDPDRTAEFEEAAAGALWYLARLLTQRDRFMERYGSEMMAGSTAWNAEALIRLAGWSGEVTADQARELRFAIARVGHWDLTSFISILPTRPRVP